MRRPGSSGGSGGGGSARKSKTLVTWENVAGGEYEGTVRSHPDVILHANRHCWKVMRGEVKLDEITGMRFAPIVRRGFIQDHMVQRASRRRDADVSGLDLAQETCVVSVKRLLGIPKEKG